MKKIILIVINIFISQLLIAQNQSDVPSRDSTKNEISINPINIVAFAALDIGYERILTANTTLGFDVFYRFSDNIDTDNDIIDRDGIFDKELALTARYKYFFGNRVAWGFYIEGFGMLSNGEHEKYIEIRDEFGDFVRTEDIDVEFTDFAIGFGVGGKFVTRKGFFIDISMGIGRNLFSDNSPDIIARPNLYLGYRF